MVTLIAFTPPCTLHLSVTPHLNQTPLSFINRTNYFKPHPLQNTPPSNLIFTVQRHHALIPFTTRCTMNSDSPPQDFIHFSGKFAPIYPTPLQIITSLYSSDSGHSTLQPGTTYAVRGDLTLLDNDDTHTLQFDPGHLLPLYLPSQPGEPDDAILIESVGTIQSIHYSASLTQHGIVKLAVVAHHLSGFGQNIVIEYTFFPTLFTAEFAGQLMLGHKMRVAGELVLWKPDACLITVEAEVAEMLN
ncbi:hypothetical protein PCASD_10840 [Puccinia coronata f. sp. avenae]|uniref:Uncharacterized protein n=1 Tax=Puccinia coronata f. sp. avenae TaxID=200324 RepID=A0A2N5UUI1_9BASI|nr:hypothetical protein PCASD_10840 [Puccinia coronata f. sp. avenae]